MTGTGEKGNGGASEEDRIQKRSLQKSKSARECRKREKDERKQMVAKFEQNEKRIAHLELMKEYFEGQLTQKDSSHRSKSEPLSQTTSFGQSSGPPGSSLGLPPKSNSELSLSRNRTQSNGRGRSPRVHRSNQLEAGAPSGSKGSNSAQSGDATLQSEVSISRGRYPSQTRGHQSGNVDSHEDRPQWFGDAF